MKVRTALLLVCLLTRFTLPAVAFGEDASAAPKVRPVRVGEVVPDFSVTLTDGKAWKLSELRKQARYGKEGVVVLTFWCSFCHSCRDVERRLDELATQFRGKALVMAVDASYGETREEVAAFKKKKQLALPIGLDGEGHAADIFGARMTTSTAVIDGGGVLRYFGQFAQGDQHLAESALRAVLADDKVKVDHTQQRG